MRMNENKIAALTALPAPKRYQYFVSTVANFEKAWGLWKDGWALSVTDENQPVFLFWPARELAESCAVQEWTGYEASEIPIDDLVNKLLPMLGKDGVLAGVFMTGRDKAVVVDTSQLRSELAAELEKYE